MSRPSTVRTPEPATHHRRVVFESMGIAVADFRCRACPGGLSAEEPNGTHSIVLVRRGVFRREHRGESLLADPNQILFFHAGEPYRYAHPLSGGDDCTILTLEPTAAVEAAMRVDPAAAERTATPFPVGHALSGSRVGRLHYELLGSVRAAKPAVATEDVLAELVDETLRSTLQGQGFASAEKDSGSKRRRREAVEEVKLLLNARVEDPPRLAALAKGLDCSPFHLSRTFRELVGVSLRGYLGRLRARLAADRLSQGARDLTDLALDLGFADHAHFTNAFRREWGVPPSRLRAGRGSVYSAGS